jgi:crotonobetainyl-CoA:carnitine CoA-transferase CaiB-like acyl-CoA transferase
MDRTVEEHIEDHLLSSHRILDLTDEKGFLAGKILGDLGADVIKIERPGGDPARNIGPFYHNIPHPEKSLYWFAYNTSKKGITLNIETRDGLDIFKRLLKTADAVIESFPVGYMDRLGLSWPEVNHINPKIVLTSITPFGQTGPYKSFKISDLTAQAMGGLMYTCGDPQGPSFLFSGAESRQSYLQAGAQAAVGTMIALEYRERTQRGQQVHVSIEECMAWASLAPLIVLHWEEENDIIERGGSKARRGNVALRSIYRCKDGYVTTEILVGARGHLFAQLVEWMASQGMAEGLQDVDWPSMDMYALNKDQVEHWEDVLSKFFMNYTRTELTEEAVKRGFMLFPVNEPKDLLDNAQAKYRDLFVKVEHPELDGNLVYPGAAYQSTECSPRIRCRAPLIGEHNNQIYRELGLNKEEIILLMQAGVI